MKLIIGLGNPGKGYEKTRHNIGFMVIDALAAELGAEIKKKQGQSLVGQGVCAGEKLLLAKPQTYMNLSGQAVSEILNFYRDKIDDLIIIHDDLDLEFGRIRFKMGGGAGGHNGLKSVTQMLNSPDYDRLKIGIGRPPGFIKVEDYVLSGFSPPEVKVLSEIIRVGVKGLVNWIQYGLEKTMNEYNGTMIKGEQYEANP